MAPSPYGSIESNDLEKATAGPSGFASNDDAENRDDRDYNLGETYYLKDNSDRRSKFLRAILPILIAVAIVGGVGYYFFRDFNHLYPGHGGADGDDAGDYVAPVVAEHNAPAPAPKNQRDGASEAKTHGEGSQAHSSSSCDVHEKCSALGLTGACCPTNEGITLGCCS